MASSLDLQVVLDTITQGLVEELDAAFARIWLLSPGDLCADCHKAADCAYRSRCQHLEASAGLYTNLNGEYRRIPLGALKIGNIAQGPGPIFTIDIFSDNRLPNVITAVHGAQSILIFGPGEAKGELKKRIESKESKGRIVAVETADEMTEPQIAAKVRQHFLK